jgi:NAD(P)-dependent dehydrogenase (short-subunit alcohol dehydrogenase family)
MDLKLAGKVAIVTGASQGIGRAIADTLASEGMRVVLVARRRSELEQAASMLGPDSLVQAVDLRDPRVPDLVVAAALDRFARLDLVVNNAGSTRRGDFFELTDEDWAEGYSLKFFAAMRLSRAAWPHLRESGGSIVNIAGMGGRTASADFTIGGSVNAAMLNLTKALADRGVQDGVRVNAINPGLVMTGRLTARIAQVMTETGVDRDTAMRQLASSLRIARFGEPAEIAAAVAFLASSQVRYCQGTVLDIDGGQTRTL